MAVTIETSMHSAANELAIACAAYRTRSGAPLKKLQRQNKNWWQKLQATCSDHPELVTDLFVHLALKEHARSVAGYMAKRCGRDFLVAEVDSARYEFLWVGNAEPYQEENGFEYVCKTFADRETPKHLVLVRNRAILSPVREASTFNGLFSMDEGPGTRIEPNYARYVVYGLSESTHLPNAGYWMSKPVYYIATHDEMALFADELPHIIEAWGAGVQCRGDSWGLCCAKPAHDWWRESALLLCKKGAILSGKGSAARVLHAIDALPNDDHFIESIETTLGFTLGLHGGRICVRRFRDDDLPNIRDPVLLTTEGWAEVESLLSLDDNRSIAQ